MRLRTDYRFRVSSRYLAQAIGCYGTAPWAMKRGLELGKQALPSFRPLRLQLRLSGFKASNKRRRWIAAHCPTDWQTWQAGKLAKVKDTLAMRRAGLHV